MRRSIATVTLPGSLPEKLHAAASAGFEGVELLNVDLENYSPQQIRKMVADSGLTIDVLQPFRDMEGVPASRHLENMERLKRTLDIMDELQTDLMLICSNTSQTAIQDDDLTVAQLAEIADLAATRSIRVGFEALSWGTFIKHDRHAAKIVRDTSHPSLGLVLDSFHSLAPSFATPPQFIDSCSLFYVQLADAPAYQSMPLLEWSRHHRCFPGHGALPVEHYVKALVGTGYRGTFSLEIFSDQLRGGRPLDVARDAMASLTALEHRISQIGAE